MERNGQRDVLTPYDLPPCIRRLIPPPSPEGEGFGSYVDYIEKSRRSISPAFLRLLAFSRSLPPDLERAAEADRELVVWCPEAVVGGLTEGDLPAGETEAERLPVGCDRPEGASRQEGECDRPQ